MQPGTYKRCADCDFLDTDITCEVLMHITYQGMYVWDTFRLEPISELHHIDVGGLNVVG